MSTTAELLDVAWILVCAALVMLMQAGFSCLESGLVRTKNSINVAAKNFADFCLSSAVFWLFGFALMFGVTSGGWIGTSGFFFDDTANPWLMAFFIFQLGFCGTATTIVSGAVSERMRFAGYLVVAAVLSAVIYPVIGHWVWNSAAGTAPGGWLEQMGFIDFAGSTVVHSVGGWIALAAIIIIGPRSGRFGKNAVPIHGHDLPMVTLGVFLLWFGWFGFNGGSTLGLTPEVPTIIVNTIVSGAFGGLVALALAWRLGGRPDVAMIMNGSLAGLVGITASAHIMTPLAAVGIGSIAAVVMYAVAILLERLEIDDVVGAVPVHLAAGIWGTLAVAIFGDPASWGTGLSRWEQLGVQATGVGAGFAWAFGVGFALLWLINRWLPLRIDPEGERVGLNVSEHGASTEILDLLTEMDDQRRASDFSRPISVEPHTEVGQIAQQYNRVLVDINAEQRRREVVTEALRQQTASLQLLREAAAAANRAKSVEDAIRTCLESICSFGGWSIGHCFMVDEAIKKLVSSKIWHLDDEERYAVFREVSERTELMSGAGLSSRVLANGEPNWIADVSTDKNFSRAAVAKDIGIKGGAAFPVLVGDDVVAVLEFFSGEPKAPDETISEVMGAVGTQLGRVVERVRSETARFNSVIDNMPANVHLRNKYGCFILVNRNYEKFFGVTNDSIRGKTLHEVHGNTQFEQVVEKSAAADREVIETNTVIEREYKIMSVGGYRTMTDRIFPITDSSGEVIAVGGVEIDITDLKRTEEALQDARVQAEEAEARLMDAIENISDGFVLYDADERLVVSNSHWRNFYKYTEKEAAPGTKYEDLVHLDIEHAVIADKGDTRKHYYNKRFGYRLEKTGSFEVDLADGQNLVIRERDTTEGGRVGVHTDITDRKRAEDALQKAYGIIKDQRDRMEDELNIGREIQMSMIPLIFPPFPTHNEFQIYGVLEPAREVGGDFYNFFFIDDERFCFCVGDVAGKGVPSALFMAVATTLIKSRAADDLSTASIITHLNSELSRNNPACMFATIFLAILNIHTGEMLYTNAGHNPPIIKREGGELELLVERHGPPAGALEDVDFMETTTKLAPKDLVLLYTDGVTEEMNADDTLYSEPRLYALMEGSQAEGPEGLLREVLVSLGKFRGDTLQSDDVTMVALQYFHKAIGQKEAEEHIIISNDLSEIELVSEQFNAFAIKQVIPPAITAKIQIALDDVLNNIVSYGFRDEDRHAIEVRMKHTGQRLTVTISDDGVAFNPLAMTEPDTRSGLDERQIGGLGVHIVRNLMDEVTYQRRIGSNVLTLVVFVGMNAA